MVEHRGRRRPAEYTGTPKELLIGFLVALAILVADLSRLFLLRSGSRAPAGFCQRSALAFLYLFAQFALYRARRYRLTRTVWRGVRFWMNGSGWSYAWRAALWGVWVLHPSA